MEFGGQKKYAEYYDAFLNFHMIFFSHLTTFESFVQLFRFGVDAAQKEHLFRTGFLISKIRWIFHGEFASKMSEIDILVGFRQQKVDGVRAIYNATIFQ